MTRRIAGPYPLWEGSRSLSLTWSWDSRDVWQGLFWDRHEDADGHTALSVYLCLLPCLPLRLEIVTPSC